MRLLSCSVSTPFFTACLTPQCELEECRELVSLSENANGSLFLLATLEFSVFSKLIEESTSSSSFLSFGLFSISCVGNNPCPETGDKGYEI